MAPAPKLESASDWRSGKKPIPAYGVKSVPSIEQLLALRDRLQAVENSLMAAGRRNVTIACAVGAFTWVQQGAGRETTEPIAYVDDLQAIEDVIVSEGHDHLVIMTWHGTFTWRPTRGD